jgi:hypothetical protein
MGFVGYSCAKQATVKTVNPAYKNDRNMRPMIFLIVALLGADV